MRILILSGGTGSVALQKGLSEVVNEDTKVQVLVNCYDNGLSTGAVRQVFGGNILGPSDLRKNQTLIMELSGVPQSVLDFMAIRFDAMDHIEAENIVLTEISAHLVGDLAEAARQAVVHFFNQPSSKKIRYDDFSASNIVYAGLAALNGNSLAAAGRVMARLTGIPQDAVILNDDNSLFLEAMSSKGVHIMDEGDIVSWNKPEDPIVKVMFENDEMPVLSSEASDAIRAADLIILSSGTQWSSLIPTYMSKGFYEAMGDSNAKVVMVMNKNPDKDAPEKTASDWIEKISSYFPQKLNVLLCGDYNSSLNIVEEDRVNHLVDGLICTSPVHNSDKKKHDPAALINGVFYLFYGSKKLFADHIVADYDDTISSRKQEGAELSKKVRKLIEDARATIISGNDKFKVNIDCEYIYADRSSNLYVNGVFMRKLGPENPNDIEAIYEIVKSIPTTVGKRNYSRAGVSVVSKPYYESDTRHLLCATINEKLEDEFPDYEANLSGSTSIEVGMKLRTKLTALDDIISKRGTNFVYIGDEFKGGGNDAAIFETYPENCVEVGSVGDTLLFMTMRNRLIEEYKGA